MTKREIKKRIYLSGAHGEYVVHTGALHAMSDIFVQDYRTGTAIVRLLREAAEHAWRGL